MSAIHGVEGLIKWIKGDEWRNDFEAVFDRHVGPACRGAGIEPEELADIIGDGERAIDSPRGIFALPSDLRLDFAPGSVVVAEAQDGVRPIGAQAHRRSFGGDPVEPRSIATCA
jgi:hypothetical protein